MTTYVPSHEAIGDRRVSDWQPIETAPKNQYVDVWCHRVGEPMSGGWRVANAAIRGAKEPRWVDGNGKWFTGKYFHDWDDEGDLCLDTESREEGAVIVTHWMPLPEPPDRVCKICDGGPGNNCACACGLEVWEQREASDEV